MSADPFRIRNHVADFDAIVDDIVERSAVARRDIEMIGDIAYGSGPAETLDIFFPPGPRNGLPVHLFIHGGYWRMFSRRDYSYVAQTITAAGAIAVIMDYALMPAVRLDVLVDQTRRAGEWVLGHIAGYGGDPDRLSVSGHSAGAHLATFLLHAERGQAGVKSALLLGGLYDLKPLQTSFLRDEIALTDEEVQAFTPLTKNYDPAASVTVVVGAEETPPFHDQAHRFAERLRDQKLRVKLVSAVGENHMSSVRNLGIPGNETSNLLMDIIRES